MSEYRSPRRVEEEIKAYRRQRFESYMIMVDNEELTMDEALAAFQDEDSYMEWVNEQESVHG